MSDMMRHEFVGAARIGLIMAHPGHELLVHHWVERTRPRVFILTDGSGGAASNRISYSEALLEKCGARRGGAFGMQSDQAWYRAILAGDARPFRDAIDRILDECRRENVTQIACDPVEHFNPMHDLANAVAHAVARRLDDARKPMPVLTFPIEVERHHGVEWRLRLDEAAMARKLDAVASYAPLAHERDRYEQLVAQRYETIAPDVPAFAWPAELAHEPYYETFGRRRLQENKYGTLITYAEHVRPIALETRPLRVAA